MEHPDIADLEAKACAMVPGIAATRDEKLAEFIAHHSADAGRYSFECRRHGDFLLVMMSRGKKFASAINLGATKQIEPIAGKEPGPTGTVYFTIWQTSDGYVPYPVLPRRGIDPSLMLVEGKIDQPHPSGIFWATPFGVPSNLRPNIPNFADPAIDDKIHFTGIDITIFTPAGIGQSVFDQIMTEFSKPGWR